MAASPRAARTVKRPRRERGAGVAPGRPGVNDGTRTAVAMRRREGNAAAPLAPGRYRLDIMTASLRLRIISLTIGARWCCSARQGAHVVVVIGRLAR